MCIICSSVFIKRKKRKTNINQAKGVVFNSFLLYNVVVIVVVAAVDI